MAPGADYAFSVQRDKGSARLGIVIPTFDRCEGLRLVLDSIAVATTVPHTIVVVDGGSSDGTVALARTRGVQVIEQGRLEGVARACNAGFSVLETSYACWLSDDTEVLDGALDTAVGILERHPRIGMVGLKMREASRPEKGYAGAISEAGILNVNHGVLPLSLLQDVGMFHEGYRSYMVDPDLVACVLATGRDVVMTRRPAVLHRRAVPINAGERAGLESLDDPARALYRARFGWIMGHRGRVLDRASRPVIGLLVRGLLARSGSAGSRLGVSRRDQYVLASARWISPFDPVATAGRPWHLRQRLPRSVLRSSAGRLSRS